MTSGNHYPRMGSPAAKADTEVFALVARQPVYDSAMTVIAYELLYRESPITARAAFADARQATLSVITNAALEIGLDQLAGGLPVHINFPREVLAENLLLPLQPQRVVIEVLEDVRADRQVVAGIEALRERGHRIALDDYTPRRSDAALLDMADIVKIFVSREDPGTLRRLVAELSGRGLELIAEGVETVEQFERCVELGFHGFQGNFLQRPQTFVAQRVPSNRLAALQLVAALQSEDYSLDEVERLLSQDVSLSYRVLRCINSSYYNLPRKVDSIRQAIVLLGLENLRRLCMLIGLQGFDDRPVALLLQAMTRARMCEQLAKLAGVQDIGPYFITGLFSMLDALVGLPIPRIVEELPLASSVTRALVAGEGDLGAALRCALAYESASWDHVTYAGLSPGAIRAAYMDAVLWAEQTQGMVVDDGRKR